jgi:hypothetical protein
MTNREGIETFERILESARPQIVVTTTGPETALRGAGALWKSPAVALPQAGITNYPRPDTASAFVAPRDGVESALATIWQDLLGIDAVGIHDDFFAELGGHSLLAAQVVRRVWETFGSDVSVRRFFEAPTIAELALVVTSRETVDSQPEPIDISEPSDGDVGHTRSKLVGETV